MKSKLIALAALAITFGTLVSAQDSHRAMKTKRRPAHIGIS